VGWRLLQALQTGPAQKIEPMASIAYRASNRSRFRSAINPTLDNIRLYAPQWSTCFAHDATSDPLDGRQDKIHLRPAEYESATCGVFFGDRVTGWKTGRGWAMRKYVPFESFET